MESLGYVKESLRRLYGYPEKLSGREAYSTAWQIARLGEYKRKVLGWSRGQARNDMIKTCFSYGIPEDVAKLIRIQLLWRNMEQK